MIPLLVVFALAAVASLVLTPIVRAVARRLPGGGPAGGRDRATPTPRLGGIPVVAAWAGTLLIGAHYGVGTIQAPLDSLPLAPILVGALLVFGVGLLDDVRPMPAGVKIAVEMVAACTLIGADIAIGRVTLFGVTFQLGWLSAVVTLAWIVLVTNAFNLIDGLDGLAAGLAVIAGITCTAIVILRGELATAVLLIALLGALAGFLPFNFNPASIFLGDGGSLFIGFVLAATAVTGLQKGATVLAAGVPILIFALPLVDTGSAVARRLRGSPAVDGRSVRATALRLLQPDQQHIHHRLVSRGLSHRTAVLVLYTVAVCLAAIAFLTMQW